MRYINWFLVCAGLFLLSMIMFVVSMFVAAPAFAACWLTGAGLNISGWITYIIGIFTR